MKKLFDLIKTIYFLLAILSIFICQVLRTYKYLKMYDTSIIIIVIGVLGILLYIFDKFLNSKRLDKYDVLIFLLIIFGIISTIFAVNVKTSIFGFYNRREGLLVIITYYILFLVSKSIKNMKYKDIILKAIIIYGLLHSVYGICQYFKIRNLLGIKIIKHRYYSTGLENNPNFFGSIIIMCLGISLSKFLINKKKYDFIYGIISIIYFMSLIVSGTMSSMISFVIIVPVLFIILLINKIKFKFMLSKILFLVITFFICFQVFNKIDKNYFLEQVKTTKNEISNVAKGNIDDGYGTGRIHIWKNTFKLASKNLINGVGIDNLYYAFDIDNRLVDIKSGLLVDKAHNEYLQKLVTEGIFSFIIYLELLIMIFIDSLTKIYKYKEYDSIIIALFIAFVGYIIQAFFNISVICVAPIFYIIMGLLCGDVDYETT